MEFSELPDLVEALQKDPSNEALQEQLYVLRAHLLAFDPDRDNHGLTQEYWDSSWDDLHDQLKKWETTRAVTESLKDQNELCEESRAWWKMRHTQAVHRIRYLTWLTSCRYCLDHLEEESSFCCMDCEYAYDREVNCRGMERW